MRVGVTLLLVEILVAGQAQAASLSDGKSAYSQNRVAEAERIFAGVAGDGSAPVADRSEARRELGRIAWLIDGNSKAALDHLAEARSLGDKPCATATLTARVLHESDLDAEAARKGPELLASCAEGMERDSLRVHLIGAMLDLASEGGADRASLLAAAAAEARNFSRDADVEAARVRFETALMTGDAPGTLAAWKDFFWLDESDAPQALEKIGATAIFERGLGPDAGVEQRLALAELLMRTGFAVQSRRFAELHQLQRHASASPVMRRLQAYWSARSALEGVLLRTNRRFARAGKTPVALKAGGRELDRADKAWRETLLAAAGEKGDADEILARNYGIVGTGRGETSGYPSIHRGHLVEDRDMTVSQYGKTAKIHYMSVDNMIANGFESWLWDGGPMVGGWQAKGVIVNVRPGYVKSPLRSYAQTRDSAARRELIQRERQRSAEDLAKLKGRPVATLNGLGDRLQLQLLDRVMAAARIKASDEAGIRRAFLAEYSRANFHQSIEVHEGRHAIDETLGLSSKVEQPVLEYQAKLSELALTAYPRMALHNMNLNLEGDGPHDKAGAKVFDEYRKWIEAHPDEVMGYDPSVPALAQLDKLSDDQIREIARGLDPLPNGKASPLKL